MSKTAKEPKVPNAPNADPVCRVYVPADPLSPGESELYVSINDVALTVPLGRLISLPESFCRLLRDSSRVSGYERESHD